MRSDPGLCIAENINTWHRRCVGRASSPTELAGDDDDPSCCQSRILARGKYHGCLRSTTRLGFQPLLLAECFGLANGLITRSGFSTEPDLCSMSAGEKRPSESLTHA